MGQTIKVFFWIESVG